MRVLLTTPPQSVSSILPKRYQRIGGLLKLLGGNKPILGIQPPYGLLYLSAYLKKAGHDVTVLDGLRVSLEEIMSAISKQQPGIVGISSVTWNWHEAVNLASEVNARFPGVRLAAGGAHVNAVRQEVLEECPEIDFAFYGDAEESFCRLVSALDKGKPPEPMDGFAFRKGSNLVASEQNSVIKNLDGVLLPDRGQLDILSYRPSPPSYRKLPFTAIFGSRGCPGLCTFCHTDRRVRLRSASSIVEEIEGLQREYDIREVLFYDDSFTLHRRRVLELCELLKHRKIELSWAANARVDGVDPQMLAAMRQAGCWRLLLGIESGSQRILDRVKKGFKKEQVVEAVAMIRSAGIQTYGMFILGFPGETYAEALETVAFMKSLDLDFVNVTALTPFPGTEIYDEVADEPGFKGFDRMNMYDISYVPTTMTERQLEEFLRKSMREFYLRVPYILGQVRNIRGIPDMVRYARGAVVALLG